jgi:HlyD family secretion protein
MANAKRSAIVTISRWAAAAVLVVAAVLVGRWAWHQRDADALPLGIVVANGRLEAIQVDVATKFAGRIAEVLFDEGDLVRAGQVVARMDTDSLQAELREAQAQVDNARSAKLTATAVVSAKQTAKVTADAIVPERQSELSIAQEQFDRSKALLATGSITQEQVDLDRSRRDTSSALLTAARSQVDEARTAIEVARSQVVGAESSLRAAIATTERIRSDLAESELRSPRTGRVQHRLAQPGEVLGAGGKVLEVVDLTDVYMTVFLPETVAGTLAVGGEARIVLDAAPSYVIPARVSYVASDAQFTPKTVETPNERQKLVFEVKLRIDPALLDGYGPLVKVGLPGIGYVRVRQDVDWPPNLAVKLPPIPDARR